MFDENTFYDSSFNAQRWPPKEFSNRQHHPKDCLPGKFSIIRIIVNTVGNV